MMTLTYNDVFNHTPTMEKYSGYYDITDKTDVIANLNKYIVKSLSDISRNLLVDGVDISNPSFDTDLNLKELILSYLVWNYYLETSYNVSEDKYFIDKLEQKYRDNFRTFVNIMAIKNSKKSLSITFVG